MPLQPEPEILGGRETQDVNLSRMLIRGSDYRCPARMWDEDLECMPKCWSPAAVQAHSVRTRTDLRNEDNEMAETQRVSEGFSRASSSGIQALRLPFEGFAGGDDGRAAPLQLILMAVSITAEYS
eukprot:6306995-Prymnesium_polylepis.1